MKKIKNLSLLAQGNHAFKNGLSYKALWFYKRAIEQNPMLEKYIGFNIALARKTLIENCMEKTISNIDVVVPVYNALEDIKECLESIKRHTDGFSVRVIVVNDGSDEPTTEWLRDYCANDPIVYLIEQPENAGYTKAVNMGLKASDAPYVIAQNSDTIVSEGWLNGLIRCMESSPKIGIVGPLSNAANWQSVPLMRDEEGNFVINDLPVNLSVGQMAQLVARSSERNYPRLPIVNGFCFMIRRDVLKDIGYMDEVNFPVGYGEETDYCIRAIDAGYELAIADDVYVFHAKSKSFGHKRRKELSRQGTQSLKKKHTPEKYFAHVDQIKTTDPLAGVRTSIQQLLKLHPSKNIKELN